MLLAPLADSGVQAGHAGLWSRLGCKTDLSNTGLLLGGQRARAARHLAVRPTPCLLAGDFATGWATSSGSAPPVRPPNTFVQPTNGRQHASRSTSSTPAATRPRACCSSVVATRTRRRATLVLHALPGWLLAATENGTYHAHGTKRARSKANGVTSTKKANGVTSTEPRGRVVRI